MHTKTLSFALLLSLMAPCALAYRPFDSTDADVAAKDELELEFGGSTLHAGHSRDSSLPAVTLNFGAGHDREFSLDGAIDRSSEPGDASRTSFVDAGLTVKQVLRRGSLQDERGVSLAGAYSVLIPTTGEEKGIGSQLLFIASRKWSAGAIHLDLAVAYETSHEWSRTLGLIVEGPASWKVRPVAEFLEERFERSDTERSVLAGFIWESRENLALDVAVREPLGDDSHAREWRAGFTWSTNYR